MTIHKVIAACSLRWSLLDVLSFAVFKHKLVQKPDAIQLPPGSCLLLLVRYLDMIAQAERDAPVDVQVGPVLYEDAPQELRSRMWMALLNDPNLTGYLSEERVRPMNFQTTLATSTGYAL